MISNNYIRAELKNSQISDLHLLINNNKEKLKKFLGTSLQEDDLKIISGLTEEGLCYQKKLKELHEPTPTLAKFVEKLIFRTH